MRRVLCDELIARAGQLAALGIPAQEIAKGLGLTDRVLYSVLRVLAAGIGLPEQKP